MPAAESRADPPAPVTLATLSDGFVDAWGVAVDDEGTIWVADGAGGVKRVRDQGGVLAHDGGDDLGTSPGTVFDVQPVGDWVVAAAGGQGLAVYARSDVRRLATTPLPGVCVDLAPVDDHHVATACRSWTHVVHVAADGALTTVASVRHHRRDTGAATPSTHIGSQLTVALPYLYSAGWDHVDAFEIVDAVEVDQPDLRMSGQRLHFGAAGPTETVTLTNGGTAALHVTAVDVYPPAAPVQCSVDPPTVLPGAVATVTVTIDDTRDDLTAMCRIASDDPDDPLVPIQVFSRLRNPVDPGETARTFDGTWLHSDGTGAGASLAEQDFDLADHVPGTVVHFAVFGTW